MDIKNILRSRKVGHGGYMAALIGVVLALAYLLNVIVLLLANHFGWYFYTAPQYDLSVGTAASALFEEIDTTGGKVQILFCDVEENVKTNKQTDFVYQTANNLKAQYPDLIELSYVNLWLEPQKVAPYLEREDGTTVTLDKTDVIIDYQGEHLVCSASSFYTLDSQDYVVAYNGEEVFVSNILWVTEKEHPTAYFTANHGESMPSPLYYALVRAGYRIDRIDLASVERVPEDAGLVVISSPLYDFQRAAEGAAFESELDKLESYVGAGGKLFVTLDPTYLDKTPKLQSFLNAYGFSVSDGVLIDENNALPGSGGYSLIASYGKSGLSAALAEKVGADRRTVLSYAAPITTFDGEKGSAESLLYSSSSATLKLRSGEHVSGADRALLAIAEVNGGEGKILLCGSSYLAASDRMVGEGYGNKALVYALLSELGASRVPIGIEAVAVDRSAIEDLSLGEARTYTALSVALFPIALLALGLFYCRRRTAR